MIIDIEYDDKKLRIFDDRIKTLLVVIKTLQEIQKEIDYKMSISIGAEDDGRYYELGIANGLGTARDIIDRHMKKCKENL